MGSTTPRLVALGAIRKQVEGQVSKQHSPMASASVPALNSCPDFSRLSTKLLDEINPFLPSLYWLSCFITAIEK